MSICIVSILTGEVVLDVQEEDGRHMRIAMDAQAARETGAALIEMASRLEPRADPEVPPS